MSSSIIRFAILGSILILGLSSLSSCALVKPWQRDALSREDMSWDPNPMRSALRAHIQFSKEASMPPSGGGGGGCGCN